MQYTEIFRAVTMKILGGKKIDTFHIDMFDIFAHGFNVYLQSNLCFETKIRKMLYPCTPQFY